MLDQLQLVHLYIVPTLKTPKLVALSIVSLLQVGHLAFFTFIQFGFGRSYVSFIKSRLEIAATYLRTRRIGYQRAISISGNASIPVDSYQLSSFPLSTFRN